MVREVPRRNPGKYRKEEWIAHDVDARQVDAIAQQVPTSANSARALGLLPQKQLFPSQRVLHDALKIRETRLPARDGAQPGRICDKY